MKKYLHIFLFVAILLIGIFLRFSKLGEVPFGFYRDESAIGYNAYSIMQTGKDEYGISHPLYFKSFGDYKLPVYVYSTIPAIQLFGMTQFAVRFPSAFFGVLTLPFLYLLIKKLTNDRALSLITLALFTISPWTLFYNRATFEVSICLFFFIVGTYCLYKSLQDKTHGLFLLGIVSFIISLYGYNLTRLLSPLLVVIILCVYRKQLKYIWRGEIVATIITSLVLLFPFVTTLFHNGGVSSASGTLIFSSAVVKAPLVELRSYFISLPSILVKVLFNQNVLVIWQYIKNLANYFSVEFFFLNGEPGGNLTIGNFGYLYLFELPFIIWGIILSFKEKKHWQIVFVLWALATIAVASLTRDVPQATRSYFLVVPVEVFSAMGMIALWQFLTRQNKWIKVFGFSITSIFIFYNIVFYFTDYYYHFPTSFAKTWKQQDQNISQYLANVQNNYQQIIIDPSADLGYTSILFFQKYPPQEFISTVKRTPDDSEGFTYVESFGKYVYRKIDWQKDYPNKNLLLVANPQDVPSNIPVTKTFSYPARPVVLALRQEMYSYPTTDIAYDVISAK